MPVVRRALFVLVACVVLAACRVDATVDVDVADDGSGTVTVSLRFDADAAARVADLDGALRTDDLVAAGWTVSGPEDQADGAVVVRARKAFAARESLPGVLAEVSNAFSGVRLERSRSFGELKWTFDAAADFSGGPERFGDDQLATLLAGFPLGRDIDLLEQEIGSSVADATRLVFQVNLPGEVTRQWDFRLDDLGPVALHAESRIESGAAQLWALVAALAAALAVVGLLVALMRRTSRRRVLRSPIDTDEMEVDVVAATGPAPPRRRLQLVVTAAHGVLWESQEQAEQWLLSLASMQGVDPAVADVRAVRRELMLGRITSAEFWHALGVPGDAAELDAGYAARFTLDPDAVDLVTMLARRGVGMACVINDAVEWSELLRTRFGLDRLIRPWVVSAELGAMKPAAAPFEEVARRAGVPPMNCLYVDCVVENLDAARELGMATVLLGDMDVDARPGAHPRAGTLHDLLASRSRRPVG